MEDFVKMIDEKIEYERHEIKEEKIVIYHEFRSKKKSGIMRKQSDREKTRNGKCQKQNVRATCIVRFLK